MDDNPFAAPAHAGTHSDDFLHQVWSVVRAEPARVLGLSALMALLGVSAEAFDALLDVDMSSLVATVLTIPLTLALMLTADGALSGQPTEGAILLRRSLQPRTLLAYVALVLPAGLGMTCLFLPGALMLALGTTWILAILLNDLSFSDAWQRTQQLWRTTPNGARTWIRIGLLGVVFSVICALDVALVVMPMALSWLVEAAALDDPSKVVQMPSDFVPDRRLILVGLLMAAPLRWMSHILMDVGLVVLHRQADQELAP